jgi:hypothetical protein
VRGAGFQASDDLADNPPVNRPQPHGMFMFPPGDQRARRASLVPTGATKLIQALLADYIVVREKGSILLCYHSSRRDGCRVATRLPPDAH